MNDTILQSTQIPLDHVRIIVAGVGGGGCNAIRHMMAHDVTGVSFLGINTDIKDLDKVEGQKQLPIGKNRTKGLGAGGDPVEGRESAIEDKNSIVEEIKDANMLFITAGMGGGTGTGAAPIVAEAAKELGILTVAVVTMPFSFEGAMRTRIAAKGLEDLQDKVDAIIIIPNDKLEDSFGRDFKILEGFAKVNDVLLNAVKGISDLITKPGDINVDFADVSSVMRNRGLTMMGTGLSEEEDDAGLKAVEEAINSPLLNSVKLKNAKGILVNVISNSKLSLHDYKSVCDMMQNYADDECRLIAGMSIDESMSDGVRVTIVVAGLEEDTRAEFTPVGPADEQEDAVASAREMDVESFLKRQMD